MGAGCSKSSAKVPGDPGGPAADSTEPKTENPAENLQKALSHGSGGAANAQKEAVETAKQVEDVAKADAAAPEDLNSKAQPAPQEAENELSKALPEADQQILAAARQQAASAAPALPTPSNSPVAYLFYASNLQGGSLILQWVQSPMTEETMKEKKLVLLATLVPARHKTIPKTKLNQNGGVTYFLQEIMYKWEMWGKSQRQEYYQGFVKFLKAADDMEATVRVHKFSSPAQPAKVYVLHTGPTENKVIPVAEEQDLNISLFAFAAVVPSAVYKPGGNITSKRFGDMATEAGGAYLQLSRRGGDAAFDQAEMVKWLAADGLKAQEAGKGVALDAAGSYERRSILKGG